MPLTGAEKQRAYMARLKAKAAAGAVTNRDPLADIIGTCDCCAKANTVVGLICRDCQGLREGVFEAKTTELAQEVERLKQELEQARELIQSLSRQLATNEASLQEELFRKPFRPPGRKHKSRLEQRIKP
jgi:hypothetical protein